MMEHKYKFYKGETDSITCITALKKHVFPKFLKP